MVVIVLEKCPISLRGDLTKWMQEVSLGVFVGRVSARVRDKLWERICEESKNGRATMVFTAQNEQHLDFRVHNTAWEPIDFDGMKLMMRPSSGRLKKLENKRMHFSNASQHLENRKRKQKKTSREPDEYVVLDLETTGLDCEHDSILEIGAIKIVGGEEADRLQCFVRGACVPAGIRQLTGITQDMIDGGFDRSKAADLLLHFIGSLPLVMHNAEFDMGFIDAMLETLDLDEIDNECIDTLKLAKKKLPDMKSYALETLSSYCEVPFEGAHRALNDACATREVFLKLIE